MHWIVSRLSHNRQPYLRDVVLEVFFCALVFIFVSSQESRDGAEASSRPGVAECLSVVAFRHLTGEGGGSASQATSQLGTPEER